jgi:Asp-tRNA(Asn)/Glu-tRNA(Gln) amidotransferase A subunit family amidase
VVGFKPSFGTLHRGGMKMMSESLDTIGVLARSVADCALAMGAMTGRSHGDPEARPDRAPRFGLTLGPEPGKAAPETLALMQRAADAARRAGAEVVEFALPPVLLRAAEAQPVVMNMETLQALGWELATARAQLSPVWSRRWTGRGPSRPRRCWRRGWPMPPGCTPSPGSPRGSTRC